MAGEWARTSDDSKLVYLHENGSWQFVEEDASAHERARDSISATPSPRSPASAPDKDDDPRAQAGDFDFRRSRWGDSRDAVLVAEGDKPTRNKGNVLAWQGTLAGLKVRCEFEFHEESLAAARYIVIEEHSNDNKFVKDFQTLAALLSTKYGEPVTDDVIWHSDLYKEDGPSEWGTAIGGEHLEFVKSWSVPGTEIVASIRGKNWDITVRVEYMSSVQEAARAKSAAAAALDDL